MNAADLESLAIALGLGLLVGIQREWSDSETAGVRTFALLTLFGAVLALLPAPAGAWCAAAGLLPVTVLLALANVGKIKRGETDLGLTTEAAVLVMYGVGVAAGFGQTIPAVVVGGATALLLHWKRPIHGLIHRIGENDFRGIAHLVLIALVILPVLPDETFGPYNVLNPHKIWLMVVLIVGISLVAYAAQRMLGARQGSVLAGLLGGLISSTATTVSYARQTAAAPQLAATSAVVIMLASTVVNLRALFEVGVAAPGLLPYAIPPLAILTAWMAALSVIVYLVARKHQVEPPQSENPAQLKAAVVFGLLYAVILLTVAAVKEHFGNQALYAVAVISGLTDVDAITLSAARLHEQGTLEPSIAWRIIMIAIVANLVFKGAAAAMLGTRKLGGYVGALFGLSIVAGGALLWLWPDATLGLERLLGGGAGGG